MTMQEAVATTNERKSLFSSYLELLEAREQQAEADRQLQEEKYLRRTQRIYDLHERQKCEAAELRRCLDYVSQHAHVLETVLRGAGAGAAGAGAAGAGAAGAGAGAGGGVPLGAALLRQAAALTRSMAACVSNAAEVRARVAAARRPQMDSVMRKMEEELRGWSSFLQRAVDAAHTSEVVVDNLHNMIAEQKRCIQEVSASSLFTSLSESDGAGARGTPGAPGTPDEAAAGARRDPACSTPLARD